MDSEFFKSPHSTDCSGDIRSFNDAYLSDSDEANTLCDHMRRRALKAKDEVPYAERLLRR